MSQMHGTNLHGHFGPLYLFQVSKNDDEKRCSRNNLALVSITEYQKVIYMWLLRSLIVGNVLLRHHRCQNSNILMKRISNFSCSTSANIFTIILWNLYQGVFREESRIAHKFLFLYESIYSMTNEKFLYL